MSGTLPPTPPPGSAPAPPAEAAPLATAPSGVVPPVLGASASPASGGGPRAAGLHLVLALGSLAALVLAVGRESAAPFARPLLFVALCVITIAELMAIGLAMTGRLSGVIIDSLNCTPNLSKLCKYADGPA